MKTQCQSATDSTAKASRPEQMKPSGQKPSNSAIYLPRCPAGIISETIDCATGNSMPMPKPSRMRAAAKVCTVGESPQRMLPNPQKIMLT
jgi:hypothetical protein